MLLTRIHRWFCSTLILLLQHSDHAGTRQLASRQPLPELRAGSYNNLMILVFKAFIVCKKTGNVKDSKFRIAKASYHAKYSILTWALPKAIRYIDTRKL